tara:strand:+ start:1100 stop:1234 length:135 start_codon:yes stop_codon:yes gene_type:complete
MFLSDGFDEASQKDKQVYKGDPEPKCWAAVEGGEITGCSKAVSL